MNTQLGDAPEISTDQLAPIALQFRRLLVRAMELNETNFRELTTHMAYSGTEVARFARDFRTVRCSIGQRAGRTTSITALATADDVIFVLGHAPAWKAYFSPKADVYSISSLSRALGTKKRWDRIWVDEWDLMPAEFRAEIYKLASDPKQQFILL